MKLLLTLLLGLLGLRSLAQTGIPVLELAHCDESMQQFMRRWNVPGASVALAKDGRLVYARAFGYADAARTVPLQPYHLLRVASISKTVTALAIMKLVEEGKLSLSHPVFGARGYLSSLAYTREIHDRRLYAITVQQLLEHTAGWDRRIGCDGYGTCDPVEFPTHVAAIMGVPNPVGDSTLIRYLLRQGLNRAPGTHYAYSNIGYLILGKVLETVTHTPYETWMREHLLLPAGVQEAHLGHNLPIARLERESSYQSRYQMLSCYDTGELVPAAEGGYQLEAMSAHGGWLFSARDLVRLMLAADGTAGQPGLLAAATLRSMRQPSAVGGTYAKGWMVDARHCWHTGQLDGTASLLGCTPDGYTWVILLNGNTDSPDFWRELHALGWGWLENTPVWPTHNLLAPQQNATELQASTADSTQAQLSWTNGTGTGRLLLLHPDGPGTAFPLDGQVYAPGARLVDGALVAASGPASAAYLCSLDPGRTYYAQVVEYRQDASTGQQPIYTLDGRPQLVLHPPVPAPWPAPSAANTNQEPAGIASPDSLGYRVAALRGTLATSRMPLRKLTPVVLAHSSIRRSPWRETLAWGMAALSGRLLGPRNQATVL